MWLRGSTRSTTSPSSDPEAPLRTPRALPFPLLLLGALLAGCPVATPGTLEQCELDLVLDTDSGMVGDTVTAVGRPITTELDTAVRVSGVDAVIVEVDRAQPACSTCDGCRVTARCDVCEACAVCDSLCEECIEIVSFEVPGLEPGEAAVTVVNSYGVSPALPLTVVAEPDDGQ